PGALRRVDDLVDAEVALRRGRRPDRVRLVGDAHVQRGAVDVGVHRDGGDAHLVERADDADGDLTAVRDEDLAKRLRHRARTLTHFPLGCAAAAWSLGARAGYAGRRVTLPFDF